MGMSEESLDRRRFLKNMAIAGLAAALPKLAGCGREDDGARREAQTRTRTATPAAREDAGLVIARGGDDPRALVVAAMGAVGGMGRFVGKGDVVVVKPNIGWSRTPEQAANTNPFVVEAIVELCLEAGARQVKVFDSPCNPARRTYVMSGIEEAARRAGGDVHYVDERKFKDMPIPSGKMVKSWMMYSEAFDADVLINVPILKHHSMARLTMGMKNLMGLLGGNRESIHVHFDQKLADINTVIRPDLTVLDAFRILKAHGPNSGTPDDVHLARHLVIGTDPVAVDSYGASLFAAMTGRDISGEDLGYLRKGNEMGLGELDLTKIEQQVVELG